MRTPVFYPRPLAVSACVLLIGLVGCNDPTDVPASSAVSGDNKSATLQPMTEASDGIVESLPTAMLGAFATGQEGCRSDYGPLIVKPTQFDFGWGRADFTTIEREGSAYRIEAVLIGVGQPDGPQRERYTIAPQADGTGIRVSMGDRALDYEPCTGQTSGVSVQDSPTAAIATKPASAGKTSTTPDAAAQQDPALVVESEGVRFFNRSSSAASPIPFGRPQAQVIAAMERVRGPAGQGTNHDCGAGPVKYANWPDGLSLVFQGGSFAGWGLDGRARGALATAIGIGPGSTRAEMENAYADVEVTQTTLGAEFSGGGYFGVFDGNGQAARITYMWAGVSCVAR